MSVAASARPVARLCRRRRRPRWRRSEWPPSAHSRPAEDRRATRTQPTDHDDERGTRQAREAALSHLHTLTCSHACRGDSNGRLFRSFARSLACRVRVVRCPRDCHSALRSPIPFEEGGHCESTRSSCRSCTTTTLAVSWWRSRTTDMEATSIACRSTTSAHWVSDGQRRQETEDTNFNTGIPTHHTLFSSLCSLFSQSPTPLIRLIRTTILFCRTL